MFFSLVLSICAGASVPVGTPCDEYVIDTHKTMKECTAQMDKRIKAANLLFLNNDDWIISCERTISVANRVVTRKEVK